MSKWSERKARKEAAEKEAARRAEIADVLDRSATWLDAHEWMTGEYVDFTMEVDEDPNSPNYGDYKRDESGDYLRTARAACAVGAVRLAVGQKVDGSTQPDETNHEALGVADLDLYNKAMDELYSCVKEWGGLDPEQWTPDEGRYDDDGTYHEPVPFGDYDAETLIPEWNDGLDEEADKDKVIGLFRRCADRVRAGLPVKVKGE